MSFSIDEPGVLFGATIFTTLRVYAHSLEHPLTAWNAHLQRLQLNVAEFDWIAPDWVQIYHEVLHLSLQHPVIRITLFPGGRELITGRSLPQDLLQSQTIGITAWVADKSVFSRSMAGYKTGNYLPAWLALNAARTRGAQEAILIDPSTGNWLETSTGNLLGWGDGCWWTPPVSDSFSKSASHSTADRDNSLSLEAEKSHAKSAKILPGIMRSQLISWLKCQNKEVSEQLWTPSKVVAFEFIAYCNSVRQVVPIHTAFIESQRIEFNAQHHCLQELLEFYQTRGRSEPNLR
ncbi:MAG: aminotransferase class IV [Cyanobacteria bacterium P01_E01_bin.6]